MKYQVGDRLRVVADKSSHSFEIGTIIQIVNVDPYNHFNPYWCCKETTKIQEEDWKGYRWIQETDLSPVKEKKESIEKKLKRIKKER